MFNDDPGLLKKVLTGNESWVYGYDMETKVQSSQWKRPEERRLKKACQIRSNMKVLLNVFFDCKGVVHHESCHRVVGSIRNINLKLCANCVKQFVRNSQNCGKTNHGFCYMITRQLTHRCLCVSF